MKKRKFVSAIAAAVLLCVSLSMPSYAEKANIDSEITVFDIVRENYISDLAISNTTGTCTSRATGDNVKSITATQTLQKKSGSSWTAVSGANWTKKTPISSLYMSNSKSGLSNGTYRLKTVFKQTNTSGQTETITVYSAEQKIS